MKSNTRLSSLSERISLRYFTFIALYFAEGLPMGILFIGIPAWMAMNNKTVTEIGAFDVACAMPWTFKFFIFSYQQHIDWLIHSGCKTFF